MVGSLTSVEAGDGGERPTQAASYRGGKAAALGWYVGQVMRKTAGRANPHRINALLRKALGDGPRGGSVPGAGGV